jgi:hypothetical protein
MLFAMKIIMLDFDGVLNSEKFVLDNKDLFINQAFSMQQNLDKEAVARLNKIIELTGAKVVVSSTWRILNSIEKLQKILDNHGFTGEIIGKTGRAANGLRGNEIAAWLNENGPVEAFVIIDDDSDMVHLMHKLVQTNWKLGLQDEHVVKCVEILNGN